MRRERPRCHRAAQRSDEIASSHCLPQGSGSRQCRLCNTAITAGKCDRRNRAQGLFCSNISEPPMSVEGQKHALPQRNRKDRFHLKEQTQYDRSLPVPTTSEESRGHAAATLASSKGRLIRCTVLGLTPNRSAILRTPSVRLAPYGCDFPTSRYRGRPSRLPSSLARFSPAVVPGRWGGPVSWPQSTTLTPSRLFGPVVGYLVKSKYVQTELPRLQPAAMR
jgi:hypothetical protein